MCRICTDFDEPDSHFCGDSHGSNYAAWCDACVAEIAAFLDPEGDAPGQLTFPFARVEGLERPVYSLRQVSAVSDN
jgi:hypothetical protein